MLHTLIIDLKVLGSAFLNDGMQFRYFAFFARRGWMPRQRAIGALLPCHQTRLMPPGRTISVRLDGRAMRSQAQGGPIDFRKECHLQMPGRFPG